MSKKQSVKDIQKKILEANLITKSDIEEFSEKNGMPFNDVLGVLLNNNNSYSQCRGCSFIVNRAYSYIGTQCENCIRRIQDHYVADSRFIKEC